MAVSNKTSSAHETTLRHLWLAGLGVVAVARRNAEAGARRALEEVGKARDQIEPTIARLGADLETRLAPVLVRLGLRAQRNARKASRRPVRRAVARKPARHVSGKAR